MILLAVENLLFPMDKHAGDERIILESLLEKFAQSVKKRSSIVAVNFSVSDLRRDEF